MRGTRQKEQPDRELEMLYGRLLLRLDPTYGEEPNFQAFTRRLALFTQVWAKNHPHNPTAIDRAEARLVKWINSKF